MAMESVKVFEGNTVPSSGESYSIDRLVHLDTSGVQDYENLDLLNDFESYVEEINDRLKIFRVVNDSVVKAVLEEAAEMVAMKEMQVTALKEQLWEGQMVLQLQEELELFVMQNAIHNLKEECEKRLLSSQFDGKKRMLCSDKLKQVSNISKDLEAVQKSLTNLEQLSTHGSLDSDYFHRRNNNVLLSSSLWEGNGSNEESNVNLPENFESSHLKLKTPAQLYSHLREMIVKIKRDHETTIQAMTEDYFSLKREFLKERELLKEKGYFSPHKNKDFDVLRKRIPDVISKLNDIVTENEDSSEMCNLSRDQYNSLLMENSSLRDMLNNREREVLCLCSRASETEEKLTQKFLSEAHLTKQIEDLKASLDIAQMEASLSEEVYKCTIRDLAHQIKCEEEGNNLKSITMRETLELIYREALYDTKAKMSSECVDYSNMQTITAQEISGVIYQDVLKDMGVQLNNLKEKCLKMEKLIVSLESEASDMKEFLALKSEEKHNLEQNILELETLAEEKTKLQITEKEEFDKELNKMMDHITKQEAKLYYRESELEELGVKHEQSLHQVHILTKTLQKAELDSNTTILQERENAYSLIDKKDREYAEQMISVIHAVQELRKKFEGFELEAAQSIKSNQLRLEGSTLQLKSLKRKAKLLRTAELWYKEKLERRCSDLQKAEAEVDVLGDEVETLVGLLEKIYIALDHYSPVLQHYPGIMEILKLVQRELDVVSTKSGSQTP